MSQNNNRQMYMSPRDYLDFIQHFVDIFQDKREELEDQQLHLNVGLNKLRDTQQQVTELQQSLGQKEVDLKAKVTYYIIVTSCKLN